MATSTTGGGASVKGSSSREGTAKAMVADQITQAIQSTSNLLHLMQQSSPSQTQKRVLSEREFDKEERKLKLALSEEKHVQLMKLPKNLLAKTSTIKNTGQVLEQMPRVISSLDAHMEHGLQSVPHLKTVSQLLANMESCQLSAFSQAQKDAELENQPPKLD